MSTNLRIKEKTKPVERKYRISRHVADRLKLYVKATQENHPTLKVNDVVQVIFENTMDNDEVFKKWLRKRNKNQ